MLIDGLNPELRYYVEEVNVDNREFNVLFDGTAASPIYQDSENRLYTARSPVKKISDHPVLNITNALIEEFAPLIVNKVWADGNASHSGQSITFSLYCNDSLVSYNNQTSFTLNSSNGWQQQFNNLVTRRGLTTFEYTVTENPISGYVPSYSGSIAGGTITITNTEVEQAPLITLKKQWFNLDGTEKTEGLPASGVEFQLFRRYLQPPEPVISGHKVRFYIRWITNSGNQNYQIGEVEVANAGSVTFYQHIWMAPPSVTASGGTLRSTATGTYQGWLNYPIYTLSNITSDVSVIFDYTSANLWNPGTFNPDGSPQLNAYEFVIQSYTQPVPTNPNPSGEEEWIEEYVATVTLTKASNWEYVWRMGSLPDKAPNGQPYYYYVKEVIQEGYSDYYINNDGITEGVITVQNVSLFSYELPETGGTGTWIFTLSALLLMLTAGLIYGFTKKRDITERRGKSPS